MSGNDQILTFPGSGTYTLDCGPGGTASGPAGSPTTCTYTTPGIYTVKASEGITGFKLANGEDKEKLIDVMQWGTAEWSSEGLEGAFYGAVNMRMSATDTPNLGSVTSMLNMFREAIAFNGDINNWVVSNVENMNLMFGNTNAFNQDLNSWDV
ncbi:MAG: BspA family leucine-rich repeat surface protein, partial [Methylococcales symbiont of Hymedesmia sp. n. MRB-2018]